VDFSQQTVQCNQECKNDGSPADQQPSQVSVPYDQLVIAVGAEPATFNIPGVRERCMFIKEIDDGIKIHHRILSSLERANTLLAAGAPDSEVDRALHWVVIGGGPTGVELTAELGDFVRNDVSVYFPHLQPRIRISLMEATGRVLGMFDPAVSAYATSVLQENGASLLCGAMVTKVDEGVVHYKTKSTSVAGEAVTLSQSVDCGTVVWAGGINARPITRHIISQLNDLSEKTTNDRTGQQRALVQTSPRGIQVDEKFRVRGLEEVGNVFAIGDCALAAGCSPTAQAAFQQGKYLGRLLRDTACVSGDAKEVNSRIDCYDPFIFHNYGALAYVGTSKGVAELKTVLWSNPLEALRSAAAGGDGKGVGVESAAPSSSTVVEGGKAFVIWRSLYFSKLLSHRNKTQVGFDWMKSGVFGRDISSPLGIPSMKNSSGASKRQ